MNLHNIVRGLITTVHPDEEAAIYRCSGVTNIEGDIMPSYSEPESIMAQFQSDPNALSHSDGVDYSENTTSVYLYATEETPVTQTQRIPLASVGDYIKRSNGTEWKVTGIQEDWSADGWMKVTATLSVEGMKHA